MDKMRLADDHDPFYDPSLPPYSSPPHSSTSADADGTPDESLSGSASASSRGDVDSTSSDYDSGPDHDLVSSTTNLLPAHPSHPTAFASSSRLASRSNSPAPHAQGFHHHVHHHFHHATPAPRLTPSALEGGSAVDLFSDALDAQAQASGAYLTQRSALIRKISSAHDVRSDDYTPDAWPTQPVLDPTTSAVVRPANRRRGASSKPNSGTSTPARWFSPGGGTSGGSPRRKDGAALPFTLPLSAPMSAQSSAQGYAVMNNGLGLGLAGPIALGSPKSSRRGARLCCLPIPGILARAIGRLLRHPLVPTQPITILFALLLFASFAASLTTFLMHVLNVDKEPLPWRTFCQEQAPFPHALADSLEPVTVFVGVFTMDSGYERRHLIRSTYARHSKPIDPDTGRPGLNVQVKFVMGRPRKKHARRVALEMEMFNDLVILDVNENMNRGKTHAFFKWADENATIPFYYRPTSPSANRLDLASSTDVNVDDSPVSLGFKKADFVVKADDDSFVVLSELERHLRVAPRQKTYWGYLIRNFFMGGECYALSSDLVHYVATYPPLLSHTTGAEDKKVAKWMRMHPNSSSINWVWERCWIYDHPKAGTTYSHGFLFPDEVERVRKEGRRGISEEERERRGGEWAGSYSTVTKWKTPYTRPIGPNDAPMTMEEEVEALVEGGGRWNGTWYRPKAEEKEWSEVVFEASDRRIVEGGRGSAENREGNWKAPEEPTRDMDMGTATRYTKMPSDLLRDPGDLPPGVLERLKAAEAAGMAAKDRLEKKTQVYMGDSAVDPSSSPSSSPESLADDSSPTDSSTIPGRTLPKQNHAEMPTRWTPPVSSSPDSSSSTHTYPGVPEPPRYIPSPSLRYDPEDVAVRNKRMLGLPHGGTVVVHYLKRNEWFFETALALLGKSTMWDGGWDLATFGANGYDTAKTDGTPFVAGVKEVLAKGVEKVGSKWGGGRMWGSPAVDREGRVTLGRAEEKEEAGRVQEVIDTRVGDQAERKQEEWETWSRVRTAPPNRIALAEPRLSLLSSAQPSASTSLPFDPVSVAPSQRSPSISSFSSSIPPPPPEDRPARVSSVALRPSYPIVNEAPGRNAVPPQFHVQP